LRYALAVSGERHLPEMINSNRWKYTVRLESPRLYRQPPGGGASMSAHTASRSSVEAADRSAAVAMHRPSYPKR
jgi:hypothetical protein